MVLHPDRDAVTRDRIYVSSRPSKPKNGMLANRGGVHIGGVHIQTFPLTVIRVLGSSPDQGAKQAQKGALILCPFLSGLP